MARKGEEDARATAGLMGSLCKFCDRWEGPGTRGLIGVLDKVEAKALGILGRDEERRERAACCQALLLFDTQVAGLTLD